MKNLRPLLIFLFFPFTIVAQNKKPLDHTVYDNWQNIGERKISNDGKWIVYAIDVQEGDGELVIQSSDAKYRKSVSRGYGAIITEDSRFAVFKIRPTYQESRQAKIKKKKPDDSPKDSLAIIELGRDSIVKIARVKSFKTPQKGFGWIAYHLEKQLKDTSKIVKNDTADRAIDSLKRNPIPPAETKRVKKTKPDEQPAEVSQNFIELNDAEGTDTAAAKIEEGTELVLYNTSTGEKKNLPFVSDYLWSKTGNILIVEGTPNKADKNSKNTLMVWRSVENKTDTISRGASDFRNFAIDEKGYQLAFVAERDSSAKSLQKFYKVWYWHNGQDSATLLLARTAVGMPLNWTISENGNLSFSKSGKRLLLGTSPVIPPKDTSLIEIDLVKVDVWHYKDDYLQSQQLKNLDQDLKRSYTALYDFDWKKMVQLGDKDLPLVLLTNEGDGDQFAGITDVGKRISLQWEGNTRKDVYAINPLDGTRRLVKRNLAGDVAVSPQGRYIVWYDDEAKQYFSWRDGKTKNISAKVPVKLYDEEHDTPNFPDPYGIVRWTENDKDLLVYDRYDIWQLDPEAVNAPFNITAGQGRKTKTSYRYIQTDPEEKFLKPAQSLLFRTFNDENKNWGLASYKLSTKMLPQSYYSIPYFTANIIKARDTDEYCFTKENYKQSPSIYSSNNFSDEVLLGNTNPQQSNFNWGTAELFKWKAYNGKQATGILYKPENFDPKKKYPLICYFYERLSDGLNVYIPPAPTPSRLNISFYVSRGYLVLAPDIEYTTGHPGKNAYDYVVSGARAVAKKGWADSTRMAIQGQSWGGYQVAYIITQTKLFKAAWAGAPVANMTSAYGGIRWESGMNRQFQYEKTQSRIGATLWDKPQLYIENSPLFHLKKVATPLVIMSNDNDGAVPWYQGIELFTGMRRLGKQVWLLNYNGEAHNLVDRKNRKDIQIREQQFFDWLLKGEKPTKWLTEGVPAVEKGREWGLGY